MGPVGCVTISVLKLDSYYLIDRSHLRISFDTQDTHQPVDPSA